jgi:threonine dehydratase
LEWGPTRDDGSAVWRWQTGIIEESFDGSTEVWLKLELFQRTGTFKLRGALNSAIDAARYAELLERGRRQ